MYYITTVRILILSNARDFLRLASLEVEEALIHMLAVTGCVLLFFLLAILLVKCELYLTYPKLVNHHKDIEVRTLSKDIGQGLVLLLK